MPFRTCASFAAAILYAATSPCHTVAARVPSDVPPDDAAGRLSGGVLARFAIVGWPR